VIEGISFEKNGCSFKGSEIDRKFSYTNLKKAFEKNAIAYNPQQSNSENPEPDKEPEPPTKHYGIRGVELTAEKVRVLKNGGYFYLEGMDADNGKKFHSYVFTCLDFKKVFFSKEQPDKFVKYGKYDMRITDKRRIEAGFLTMAKVKMDDNGNYSYSYLWKINKNDMEYTESWEDPREQKNNRRNWRLKMRF